VRLKRDTERWGLPQASDVSIPLRSSRLNKLRGLTISVELSDPIGLCGCRPVTRSTKLLAGLHLGFQTGELAEVFCDWLTFIAYSFFWRWLGALYGVRKCRQGTNISK